MDKFEKLTDLMKNDAEKARELLEATPEAAAGKLAEMGLDFTVDELKDVAKGINEAVKKAEDGGELSEDDLEHVAGGSLLNNKAERTGYYVGCAIIYGGMIAVSIALW